MRLLALIALSLSVGAVARADEPVSVAQAPVETTDEARGISWTFGAYGIAAQPDAWGGELSISATLHPWADHEFFVGPKVSALYALAENDTHRFDFNWGLSSTLWFVNAVGSGLDIDLVAPSQRTGAGGTAGEDSRVNLRVTPSLSIRLLRMGKVGAWAVRMGIPYDTHYKWGVQAGITLQPNGVDRITTVLD